MQKEILVPSELGRLRVIIDLTGPNVDGDIDPERVMFLDFAYSIINRALVRTLESILRDVGSPHEDAGLQLEHSITMGAKVCDHEVGMTITLTVDQPVCSMNMGDFYKELARGMSMLIGAATHDIADLNLDGDPSVTVTVVDLRLLGAFPGSSRFPRGFYPS